MAPVWVRESGLLHSPSLPVAVSSGPTSLSHEALTGSAPSGCGSVHNGKQVLSTLHWPRHPGLCPALHSTQLHPVLFCRLQNSRNHLLVHSAGEGTDCRMPRAALPDNYRKLWRLFLTGATTFPKPSRAQAEWCWTFSACD